MQSKNRFKLTHGSKRIGGHSGGRDYDCREKLGGGEGSRGGGLTMFCFLTSVLVA